MKAFARYHRVLAVLFTGGGKSEVALSVIRRFLASAKTPEDARALFLAHRDELVAQPIERAPRFGMAFAREQGPMSALGQPHRVVSSTVQSMAAVGAVRCERYDPDAPRSEGPLFECGAPGKGFTADRGGDECLRLCSCSGGFKAQRSRAGAVCDDRKPRPKLSPETCADGVEHALILDDVDECASSEETSDSPLESCSLVFEERPRYEQYSPDTFQLIVVDEAHHSAAAIYGSVLDYFTGAYVLGITATPNRLDGVSLGEVFEAYAFDYAIDAGIADGWLVPVNARRVIIPDLDLNKLRAKAGDLDPGPLGELMAEYAHPVAQTLVALTGDRPTIGFCATVAHAHAQAAALRRYTDERVEVIDGETNKDTRRQIFADFKTGALRWLINCEVATEGVDAPMTACVAMIRPTKSQSLMAQMIGRGTRPQPGVVDQPHLRDDPDGRRAAIAASAKPDLLVLDFSGVCEKHSLANPEDVLAGRLSPEERLLLGRIELVKERDAKMTEILAARKAAAAEAARVAARVQAEAETYELDPFAPAKVLSLRDMPRNDPTAPRCSEKMAASLTKQGIPDAAKLSDEQAKKIQGALGARYKQHLASYRQCLALQKAGVPPRTTTRISYDTASKLITDLANNGWQRPRHWNVDPRLGGIAPRSPMVVPPVG